MAEPPLPGTSLSPRPRDKQKLLRSALRLRYRRWAKMHPNITAASSLQQCGGISALELDDKIRKSGVCVITCAFFSSHALVLWLY